MDGPTVVCLTPKSPTSRGRCLARTFFFWDAPYYILWKLESLSFIEIYELFLTTLCDGNEENIFSNQFYDTISYQEKNVKSAYVPQKISPLQKFTPERSDNLIKVDSDFFAREIRL